MEDKIIKLIEEKGPEIASTLKIASEQVYDRVLWYIRMNGVLNLVTTMLVALVAIFLGTRVHRWFKKNDGYGPGNEEVVIAIWLGFLVVVPFLSWAILDGIIAQIVKLVVPEYWIINQIIQKIGQ